MTIQKYTLRQKIFRKYWYFNLFYGRAHTYVAIPINLIQFVGLITLWIKLMTGYSNKLVLTLGFVLLFTLFMIIGILDWKYKIINEQHSFQNQFNPELVHLVKQTKKKVKI